MRYTIFYFLLFFYFLINNGFSQLPPPPVNTSEVFPKEVYDRILEDGEFKLNHLGQDSLIFSTKFFSLKMPKLQENVRLSNTRFLIENGSANQKIRINYLLKSAFKSRNSPFREERKLRNYLIPFLTGDLYGISEYFLSSNEKKLVENFHNSSTFKVQEKKEYLLENTKIMKINGENLISKQFEQYYFFEIGEYYFVISYINFDSAAIFNTFSINSLIKEIKIDKSQLSSYKQIVYQCTIIDKLRLSGINVLHFNSDSLKVEENFIDNRASNLMLKLFYKYYYDNHRNLIKQISFDNSNTYTYLYSYDNDNFRTSFSYNNLEDNTNLKFEYKRILLDSTEKILNFQIPNDTIKTLISETHFVKKKNYRGEIIEMDEYFVENGKSNLSEQIFYDKHGRIKKQNKGIINEYSFYNDESESEIINKKFAVFKYFDENGHLYLSKTFSQLGKLSGVTITDNCKNTDLTQLNFSR